MIRNNVPLFLRPLPAFARLGPGRRFLLLFAAAALLWTAAPAAADEGVPPADAATADQVSLEEAERAVAARFARLEETLLKMARYLRRTEPERADLLVRALQKSREERIEVRLGEVADLLRSDAAAGLTPSFGDAIERQAELIDGMKSVLGLLRSEDRRREIDSEQERLKALLKEVGRLQSDQKAAEAANRRGDSTERIKGRQKDVNGRTDSLLDRIEENDARGKPKPGESSDAGSPGESSDTPPGGEGAESGEPKEGDPSESEPQAGESIEEGAEPGDKPEGAEPGDTPEGSEPGESGDPQEGGEPPESGKPSEGSQPPSDGPPPQGGEPPQGGQPGGESPPQPPSDRPPGEQPESEKTPGREQLDAAKQAMEDALKELEAAERDGAAEAQREAVKKLAEAKEALEQILRQLREEEAELVLRALEVRFQKMLTMQQAVLSGTESLAGAAEWSDRQSARVRDLAREEREIGIEAEKALQLLLQDGSSVAFPEALEQVAADVAFAAELLAKERVDELTRQVERDVIESLEELIDALRQELERLRERKESGQQGEQQQGQPGEEGLVDTISELKMLRTLQKGVNRRTRLLGLETTGDLDVAARLADLAGRQRRIEAATYDLAVGKTN